MTDEQIKKQSEEYATNIGCDEQTGIETLFISPTKKQAFQDGAKWMQEHAIEWHDLKEDPKNLPIENGEYWSNIGLVVFYCTDSNHSWFTPLCEACDDQEDVSDEVIAWCKLPIYRR